MSDIKKNNSEKLRKIIKGMNKDNVSRIYADDFLSKKK